MKLKRDLCLGLKRKLQGIALGITGRNISVVEIPREENEIGYTSQGNRIHLSFDNQFTDKLKREEQVMFVEGVFTHELMHQIATDFKNFERAVYSLPLNQRKIFSIIFNVLEDPAIEYWAPCYIGGHLLRALSFTIMTTYRDAMDLSEIESPFSQFLAAFIQYGDGGLLKGDFTFDEAREKFVEALPLFDKGIEEKDGKRRIKYAKAVFDISKPLWEEELKNEEAMKKLLEELSKMMEQSGKGTSGSGSEPMNDLNGADGAEGSSSEMKRKRRQNTAASSKERAGCSSDSPQSFPKSSSDSVSGSNEGKGSSFAQNTSKTQNKEKEDGSKNDDSSIPDSNKGEGGLSTNHENANDSKFKSDQTFDMKKDLDKKSADEITDGSGEISNEEYTLSKEDISEIKKIISDSLKIIESEKKDSSDAAAQNLDIEGITTIHGNASCKNIRIKTSDNSALMDYYDSIVSSMQSGINNLTNSLKRIFKNDVEDREYRSSGRVNIKRMSSGRLTSRVFDRRKAPSNKSDICVMLLVDESGSMGTHKSKCAREAAIGLAEVFANLKIPTSVIGFTADVKETNAVHYHYMHWANNKNERIKLLNIKAQANNFDGYSIRYATKLIGRRPEKNKLLVVLSDGKPQCFHYRSAREGVADTTMAIQEASKKVDIIGVGIGDADTDVLYTMYKNHFLHIKDASDIFNKLGAKIKERVKLW